MKFVSTALCSKLLCILDVFDQFLTSLSLIFNQDQKHQSEIYFWKIFLKLFFSLEKPSKDSSKTFQKLSESSQALFYKDKR